MFFSCHPVSLTLSWVYGLRWNVTHLESAGTFSSRPSLDALCQLIACAVTSPTCISVFTLMNLTGDEGRLCTRACRGTVTTKCCFPLSSWQESNRLETIIVHDPILHGEVTLLWEGCLIKTGLVMHLCVCVCMYVKGRESKREQRLSLLSLC